MKNNEIIVISGSSRIDGNTNTVINEMLHAKEYNLINLSEHNIAQYKYENQVRDDFEDIMDQITEYDIIIYSTPVYGHCMSGLLKTFFDRMAGLTKQTRAKLENKKVFLIWNYHSSDADAIENIFRKNVTYMKMNFLGGTSVSTKDEQSFRSGIEKGRDIFDKMISL